MCVDLQIIRVLPYVELRYTPCTREHLVKRLCELSRADNSPDFLEGLLFDEKRGVLVEGFFSDNSNGVPVNHVRAFWSKWYYKQVEEVLETDGCNFNKAPTRVEVEKFRCFFPLVDFLHQKGGSFVGLFPQTHRGAVLGDGVHFPVWKQSCFSVSVGMVDASCSMAAEDDQRVVAARVLRDASCRARFSRAVGEVGRGTAKGTRAV